MISDFCTLMHSPVAFPNCCNRSWRLITSEAIGLRNSMTSSAYRLVLNLIRSSPIGLRRPCLVAMWLEIHWAKWSALEGKSEGLCIHESGIVKLALNMNRSLRSLECVERIMLQPTRAFGVWLTDAIKDTEPCPQALDSGARRALRSGLNTGSFFS
jgi:hypothetical protein